MSLGTILLIVIVIALLGGFSGFGGGPFYGTGYYGGGGLGLVLIILNGYPLHSRSLKGWGSIVGGNDLMVRCRPAGDGLLDEAMEEQSAGLGAPAVEAEGEFVEVVVEMLELDAALMGSHQPSLKQ